MKKYFYPILPFLLITLFTKAQTGDKLTNASTIETKNVQYGKSLVTEYSIGGEKLTQKALEKLLLTYPNSALELNAYKEQRKKSSSTTLILLSVGLSSAIAASIEANQEKNKNGSNFSKAPFFFSVSIASLISPLFFLRKNQHLNKSIEAYNNRL